MADAIMPTSTKRGNAETVAYHARPIPRRKTDGTKVCTGCGEEKDVSGFHRNNAQSTGLHPRCKACVKAYQDANRDAVRARNLEWYRDNREQQIQRMKTWRTTNPEAYRACKKAHYDANRDAILERKKTYRALPETKRKNAEYMKRWISRNRERMRQHDRKRYHATRKFDIRYCVNKRIQKRMLVSLKGAKAGQSWESLVGYTVRALMKRLKASMPYGYTWDDFLGGDLHIDHIVPVSAHHFSTPDDIDFKRCWALSNLQLLPARVNCAKGAKLSKPFQPSFAGI